MDSPPRSPPPRSDADEARDAWRPSLGYLAVAVGAVAGAVAFWLTSAPPRETVVASAGVQSPAIAKPSAVAAPVAADASNAPAAPVAAPTPAAPTPAAPPVPRAWEPGTDPTPDLSAYVNPGEKPTTAQVIERLHQAGVHGGLAAFPPPGTRPPLVGLAVPDDFVLPEGYVRHYQTTDDGQRIEPILMFSPDRPPLDAAQNPIAVTDDRVVPPELAPPGLPLRQIVIPEPTEARGGGR